MIPKNMMRIYTIILLFCMLIPAEIVRADQPLSPATEVFKGYDIYATTIVREDSIW